jgi:hypothetical protein
LNVLDVPAFNQDRKTILYDFKKYINGRCSFILPMATIWETGNHIADLAAGGNRFKYSQKFVQDVTNALSGNTPYTATHFPDREEFLNWLSDYPEYAKTNKSSTHRREGTSLSDLSIIKEWENMKKKTAQRRVLIWSLDTDLQAYDYTP